MKLSTDLNKFISNWMSFNSLLTEVKLEHFIGICYIIIIMRYTQ